MPKRRRYYRKRPLGKPAKWRPLGKLTEDHLFILSIVTVLPGVDLKNLRDIYVLDCQLIGKPPLKLKRFLRRLEFLMRHALVRCGLESVDEKTEGFYPGPRMPGMSLRRACMKQLVCLW